MLQMNFQIGELSITTLPTNNGGGFLPVALYLYKVTNGVIPSLATLTSIVSIPSTTLTVGYLPYITGTYSWTQIPTSGTTGTILSIANDTSNNNTWYVSNDDIAGKVYKGTIIGGTMVFTLLSSSTIPKVVGNCNAINMMPTASVLTNSTAYNYSISSQTREGYYSPTSKITGLTKNFVSGEFLMTNGTELISLPPTFFTPTPNWTNSSVAWNIPFAKNGEDISAGDVDIFNMRVLIDAINAAYAVCFAHLPAGSFNECPYLTLNDATGLLTLNYSSDVSTLPYTKWIMMNPALIQLCKFPNVVDSINPYLNDITPITAGTSMTQYAKSIYLFNQLDKIVFISNTIFVSGSFFGNNNTNNIITDVDVPINSAGYVDNVGEVLYYQPNFLRPYVLSSNNALQRIQLYINYVYRDGTQYPLLIAPNSNFSAKLIFIRRY
jgi:hypothetical protein